MLFAENDYMPPLTTPDLHLRRLTMGDAADMFEYSEDPDVARFVLWYPHRTISDTRSFLRYTLKAYRAGEPASYGIALNENDRVIGTIGFSNISYEHRCAEIGYSLSKAYWNHGYMTQALNAMLHYGFERQGYYRIEAVHDIRNEASGRVMEKCGMRLEGTMRGKLYSKGEHITVRLYAVTLPDFKSLR